MISAIFRNYFLRNRPIRAGLSDGVDISILFYLFFDVARVSSRLFLIHGRTTVYQVQVSAHGFCCSLFNGMREEREGVKEPQPSKHTHSEVRKGRKEIINWSCCFNYSLRGERGGLW